MSNMKRPWQIWLVFVLSLGVVLAALGWVSLIACRLDRTRAEADRQAAIEENVRLALWRMESALGPLIARESGRPYFLYSAFYPAERAYHRMFGALYRGEVLVPSPLLTWTSPYMRLHFQYDSDHRLTSPEVPRGNLRGLAITGYTTAERIAAAEARLSQFQAQVGLNDLRKVLADLSLEPAGVAGAPGYAEAPLNSKVVKQQARQQQMARNQMEWQARSRANRAVQSNLQQANVGGGPTPFPDVRTGAMTPRWVGSHLVLLRRVSADGREYVQGCWLDWPFLKEWLLGEVADLLPSADLEPATGDSENRAGRLLAALPIRLVPGALPGLPVGGRSTLVFTLAVAWAGVLLAAGAAAVLLAAALSLSERRKAFVSAVTHELRTPLTTFRLYTEMLDEGMVPEEGKRRGYLARLRSQAERLGHLVDNVLAYAELDGRSAGARVEPMELGALVRRAVAQLRARADQADMHLVVSDHLEQSALRVRANPDAVERILINLMDNACKYAAEATDRRVHLEVERDGADALLRVRDHGPGIATTDVPGLFRAFSKSAQEAADSAPGVGLGLALSRRLARQMGGDLRLEVGAEKGACFVLALPVDQA